MTSFRHLIPAIPFLVFIGAATLADEEPVAQINLTNGNRLTGTPGAIDPDGNLLLTSAENLAGPGALKISSLLDVRLPATTPPARTGTHQATLRLTNGDTIQGQLSALDTEHVTLDSWYGGTIRIRRSMSESLEILRSEKRIYSGPDAIENWTTYGEEAAWSFDKGQFITSGEGGIARQFELPDVLHFRVDLSWRNSLNFRAHLFANEGENDTPENSYELVCQRRFVYLRKRWATDNNTGSESIGRGSVPELAQNERVRLDLYINRNSGSFTFFVDGKQSQVWTDPNPQVGAMGNWLHLLCDDGPMRVTRLEAGAWSGDLPNNAGAPPSDPPLDEEGQIIQLQNGDALVGEVGEIKDGVLSMKTKHVDNIQVPIGRMRSIDLTVDKPEEPKREKGDIRAWLHSGGHITFQLKAFRDGKLTGYSQTFGTIEFDLSAFNRLDFNIYQEEFDALREIDSW